MALLSLDEKTYHDGSHVGIHALLYFEEYGAHAFRQKFKFKDEAFKEDEDDDGGALGLGRLAHKLILEDCNINDYAVAQPDTYTNDRGETKPWNGNANACKEQKDKAIAGGKAWVKHEELVMLGNMRTAIRQEVRSSELLRSGIPEAAIRKVVDGVPVQCRVDWLATMPGTNGQSTFDWKYEVDLKTVGHLSQASGQVWKLGYIRQRAWYRYMLNLEAEAEVNLPSMLVFVEKHPAHRVWVRPIAEDEMVEAHAKNMAALSMLAECWATDRWPRLTSDQFTARMEQAALDGAARRQQQAHGALAMG